VLLSDSRDSRFREENLAVAKKRGRKPHRLAFRKNSERSFAKNFVYLVCSTSLKPSAAGMLKYLHGLVSLSTPVARIHQYGQGIEDLIDSAAVNAAHHSGINASVFSQHVIQDFPLEQQRSFETWRAIQQLWSVRSEKNTHFSTQSDSPELVGYTQWNTNQ
jgi:hypothetical protein